MPRTDCEEDEDDYADADDEALCMWLEATAGWYCLDSARSQDCRVLRADADLQASGLPDASDRLQVVQDAMQRAGSVAEVDLARDIATAPLGIDDRRHRSRGPRAETPSQEPPHRSPHVR